MSELRFYEKSKKLTAGLVKTILAWVIDILIVVVLAYICVVFFGQHTMMVGQSMADTIEDGDDLLVNRLNYKFTSPKRGDIIVFKPNGNEKTHLYVKRVIGLPGERIQIREGRIYINGMEYDEDSEKVTDAGVAEDEIVLAKDEYFVLGDNRENSEDSRFASVGNVKKNDIIGKAWCIILPGKNRKLLSRK